MKHWAKAVGFDARDGQSTGGNVNGGSTTIEREIAQHIARPHSAIQDQITILASLMAVTESVAPPQLRGEALQIEFRHLHCIVAAADHGSFRRVARVLGIEISAVSRRVRDVEDQLGAGVVHSPQWRCHSNLGGY